MLAPVRRAGSAAAGVVGVLVCARPARDRGERPAVRRSVEVPFETGRSELGQGDGRGRVGPRLADRGILDHGDAHGAVG
ncbi:hypothetical protein EU76_15515, partial [Staphylococcus aureus]